MDNTPYDKGFQAYQNGDSLIDNPYNEGSDDFYEWESGWVNASGEDGEDD